MLPWEKAGARADSSTHDSYTKPYPLCYLPIVLSASPSLKSHHPPVGLLYKTIIAPHQSTRLREQPLESAISLVLWKKFLPVEGCNECVWKGDDHHVWGPPRSEHEVESTAEADWLEGIWSVTK